MEELADVPLFRFVTGRFPVTPVVRGKPVALVSVTDDGVPSAGVTRVGDVAKTLLPVPVLATTDSAPVLPDVITAPLVVRFDNVPIFCDVFTESTLLVLVSPVPATELATVVALPAEVMGPVRLAFVVTFPAVNPAAVPVMFVPTKEDGVPRAGVINVGDVESTALPVPVEVVTPVPPLATAKVPARVIAPLVADEGVSPVEPALKVVTIDDGLKLNCV